MDAHELSNTEAYRKAAAGPANDEFWCFRSAILRQRIAASNGGKHYICRTGKRLQDASGKMPFKLFIGLDTVCNNHAAAISTGKFRRSSNPLADFNGLK